MSFTITSSSPTAVITEIGAQPNGPSMFTITGGTLPLLSGGTITGNQTNISNNFFTYFGAQNGQIYLMIEGGSAQIELTINGSLYSSADYSSGFAIIETPIISSTDTILIEVKNQTLPPPSPTPSGTPAVTSTPTPTPSSTPAGVTPTPTSTPTPTPSGSAFDSDAAAYLNILLSQTPATGITPTVSAATNTLFTELKTAGLYDKLVAFYPVLGGDNGSIAVNANLDTTYDLDISSGWIASANAFTPNGVDAYADTFYAVPSSAFSNSFGVYVTTSATTNTYECDMGVNDTANTSTYEVSAYWNDGNASSWYNQNLFSYEPNTTDGGFYHNVRTAQNNFSFMVNGQVLENNTTSVGTAGSDVYTLYLGARNNNGTASFHSTKPIIFAYIATGMTTGNTVTFDTIVNDFQTTLGRNTY